MALSDHMAFITTMSLPSGSPRNISPKFSPLFKVKPEIIKDQIIKERIKAAMTGWLRIKEEGLAAI